MIEGLVECFELRPIGLSGGRCGELFSGSSRRIVRISDRTAGTAEMEYHPVRMLTEGSSTAISTDLVLGTIVASPAWSLGLAGDWIDSS